MPTRRQLHVRTQRIRVLAAPQQVGYVCLRVNNGSASALPLPCEFEAGKFPFQGKISLVKDIQG